MWHFIYTVHCHGTRQEGDAFKNRRANFPGRAWTTRGVANLARSGHNRGSTKLSTPSPPLARRWPHRGFLRILRVSSLSCGGLVGFQPTTVQFAGGATQQQQQQECTETLRCGRNMGCKFWLGVVGTEFGEEVVTEGWRWVHWVAQCWLWLPIVTIGLSITGLQCSDLPQTNRPTDRWNWSSKGWHYALSALAAKNWHKLAKCNNVMVFIFDECCLLFSYWP